MRFSATTEDTETSECGRYVIKWHAAGFGMYIAKVYCDGVKINQIEGSGARELAQATCRQHAKARRAA